ncbi:embryonic polyadenylate-binding protein 2 isoform X1 [Trachypithecus francoisi]|uniref:embryonic polyadenylate-binding protein 2 isoform X1 n=1 Tax=Trachypithecus francoisi TaxID=54180 RepID=UPI00141B40A4|nr:embryonic polyadenylate-binding protein 2 isoform X1 [Trachypithecus francoisi]
MAAADLGGERATAHLPGRRWQGDPAAQTAESSSLAWGRALEVQFRGLLGRGEFITPGRSVPVQRRAVTLCWSWQATHPPSLSRACRLPAPLRAMCWQELEAIKMKVCAMEQAEGPPWSPGAQHQAEEEEGTTAGQLLSPEAMGCPLPGTPEEKVEADHRSVYVGNVDYGGSAEELEAHFSRCGEVHRVTILCDKFSGHPKGYAYIEFATKGSVQAAVELDQSLFRGRVIKVLPKRTNFPGISSTDRGGLRGHPGSRGPPFPLSGLQGRPRLRLRGQNRARGKFSPWFSPY